MVHNENESGGDALPVDPKNTQLIDGFFGDSVATKIANSCAICGES